MVQRLQISSYGPRWVLEFEAEREDHGFRGTLADDLGALFDHLDLRDVTLVSHSASSAEIVPVRVGERAGRQRLELKQPEQLRQV